MLLALALVLSARAATIGSPVADPDAGRISLEALGGLAQSTVRDVSCEGSDGCLASWKQSTAGGRVALTLLPGLGLTAEVGWSGDRVNQARYRGSGARWAAGAQGSLGLGRGVRLAAAVSWEQGHTRAKGEAGEVTSEDSWTLLRLAPLLVLAPEGGLTTLTLGPTWRLASEQHIWLASTQVTSVLAPDPAWGAVVGAEHRSDPLGPPWQGHAVRLLAGAEARWEGGLGADVRVGLVFW
jgi:hypothetical protein